MPEAPDYDYEGAAAAGVKPDARGHYPDTYKLPNHITFSDDSKYDDGGAGTWKKKGGKWHFTPGETNLKHHSIEEIKQYFKDKEPDAVLDEATAKSKPRRSVLYDNPRSKPSD